MTQINIILVTLYNSKDTITCLDIILYFHQVINAQVTRYTLMLYEKAKQK